MNGLNLGILRTALISAVGFTSEQNCAAFRAGIANPRETRYIDSNGEWIMAHEVPLASSWRGLSRLAKLAATAIHQVVQELPPAQIPKVPLLLSVAEADRPGRTPGLEGLIAMVQKELGVHFSTRSMIVAHGRVAVAAALAQARDLIRGGSSEYVVVAATDSLLTRETLAHLDRSGRLLTEQNSNGFMPGEAAGALLCGDPTRNIAELTCRGYGFALEVATIGSEAPFRADGLTKAFKAMLHDASCSMHDIDFRIADMSGEQYYFKEAALALSRTLRTRKAELDLWHPAECTGEIGAASGIAVVCAAAGAWKKHYDAGKLCLAHMANDAGQRAAVLLEACR